MIHIFFYNNKQYIVEMDGGLGHGFYNCDAIRGIGLNGKDLDEYKDKMALEHNIFVIRIDCFYTKMEDRFSYIKNSIQNSELSNILIMINVINMQQIVFQLNLLICTMKDYQ